MRIIFKLFAALTVLSAQPLLAQGNGSTMADTVRQLRITADQMEGKLPAEDIAEMRRSADELEKEYRKGAFNPLPVRAAPEDVAGRIAAEHNGKVDWLDQHPACVGYGWENYRTFRLNSGDRDDDRNILCQRAFGHLAAYFAQQRSGDFVASRSSLAAYDKAAHEAVDFFERR
ncbi:hypothetical protein [Novosphingobium sp.]|uniref:hypothetical protein n=1 Tax=Novosphingobium sp. TaxID=1874826 RepID=UPI00260DE6A4|nr:hypothetical protein [Novosphingobium sp.]